MTKDRIELDSMSVQDSSSELSLLKERVDRLLGAEGENGQIWERLGILASKQDALSQFVTGGREAAETASEDLNDLSDRMDSLEEQIGGIAVPIWRRANFLGGFAAVGVALALYIVPPIWRQADPAFPRFVHASILHTDKALASGLASDVAQTDPSQPFQTPLYPAIKNTFHSMINRDQDAILALADLVRSKQRDFFHGSVSVFQREIVTQTLGCRALSDPLLYDVVARFNTDEAVHDFCTSGTAFVSIPFFDPVSLKVPFNAKKGDIATARITLSETVTGGGGQTEQRPINPQSILDFYIGDSQSIDLPLPDAAFESVYEIPIEDDQNRRSITLSLSEIGQELVESGAYLTISAVVDVTRN